MNNYTLAISSFVRFSAVVFNTFEYCTRKEKYELKAYQARKQLITDEITNNTPLKNCLDNSGEAGEKLYARIKELLNTVYSDDSTIVRVSGDEELRVDAAQHLTVFELVLPIYEEMKNIIRVHVNAAKKENAYDDLIVDEATKKMENYYRGLANMLLLDEFDHLFADYNKARQEAKGAITPQSNFIQNDINKCVGFFNSLRQNSLVTSTEYYEMIDPLFALIEMTSGRRDLPAGKNFGDVFLDVKKVVHDKTHVWEVAWQETYHNFLKHFDDAIKEINQKNAANAN